MSKIIIFSGSGLSRSLAGIPTQQEGFLNDVLNEDRKEWVIGPLKDNKEKEIIKDWYEPEMLLSYLYYQDLISKLPKQYKRPYKSAIINFRIALNEYLFQFTKNMIKNERNKFESLLTIIEKNTKEKCTIITTNYDLLCESIVGEQKYSYCLIDNADKSKHKILKLHGSINWLEDPKRWKDIPLNKHIIQNLNFFKGKIEKNFELIKTGKDDYKYIIKEKHYKPITIPFFFQKYDWYSRRWNSIFKDCIWKKAEEALLNAKCIIFIGWGIASADYPILALLNKAKWWDKKIIVINRSAENFYKYGIKYNYLSGKYLQDFEEDEFKLWIECVLKS